MIPGVPVLFYFLKGGDGIPASLSHSTRSRNTLGNVRSWAGHLGSKLLDLQARAEADEWVCD